MSAVPIYGSDALRRLRERQDNASTAPECQPSLLSQVDPDAPMDDATLTVWNGDRFVDYDTWLATAQLHRDETHAEPQFDAEVSRVVAVCGNTPVRLARDGERWLIITRPGRAWRRRRDFASPYLAHAIRVAEQWFGVPLGGWRAEELVGDPGGSEIQ